MQMVYFASECLFLLSIHEDWNDNSNNSKFNVDQN